MPTSRKNKTALYEYDVFISYSSKDKKWVQNVLIPQLEKMSLKVMVDRDFEAGVSSLVNMERAIENSRHTIVVLTPDWINGEWTHFESLLASTADPTGRRRKLIPLLLKNCKLPNRLAMLTYIDFIKSSKTEDQMTRLVNSIRPRTGPPLKSPLPPTGSKGWIRPVSLAFVVVFITLLIGIFTNSSLRQRIEGIFSNSSAMVSLSTPALSQTPKVLLITEFEDRSLDLTGKNYSIGIQNQIMALLVNSSLVTVVEPNKLNDFLKEQKLSKSDIIDPETAIKVGKTIGVQKVLLGEYQLSEKGKFSISCRLVDTEKGIIEDQWIASDIEEKEIKKYSSEVATRIINTIKTQLALEKIAQLENAKVPFNVFISARTDTFYFGDMLNFNVEADKDCYVLLFDVGTSGKIHLLFPNRMQPNNFIKAGQIAQIENIRVTPPAGTEMVKAIATLDSVSFAKMLELASLQMTFLPIGNNADEFARDLEVVVSPLANDRWTAATLTLEIREK